MSSVSCKLYSSRNGLDYGHLIGWVKTICFQPLVRVNSRFVVLSPVGAHAHYVFHVQVFGKRLGAGNNDRSAGASEAKVNRARQQTTHAERIAIIHHSMDVLAVVLDKR